MTDRAFELRHFRILDMTGQKRGNMCLLWCCFRSERLSKLATRHSDWLNHFNHFLSKMTPHNLFKLGNVKCYANEVLVFLWCSDSNLLFLRKNLRNILLSGFDSKIKYRYKKTPSEDNTGCRKRQIGP